ncbi:hypothetical protein EDB85DRAFT_1927275 [Lactarius pseudohatsudake]|nr:hypothetical protein EDB85DRAFT_1927275 [Lactarius pseudohatsudake]
MSLAALATGAECGPMNPLQGLTKNLDGDRGLQQDHFGANRTGSSRGGFRTAQAAPSGFDEESARFFAAGPSTSSPHSIAPSPFDLAALRSSLPAPSFNSPRTLTPVQSFHGQAPTSSWATDFLKNVPKPSMHDPLEAPASSQAYSAREHMGHPSFPHVLQSQLPMHTMPQMSTFGPLAQTTSPSFRSSSQMDREQLENAFQSLEQQQTPAVLTDSQAEQSQTQSTTQPQEADLLARTAGLLVQSVDHERNPKFANSEFLGLMKQLRDRTAIVQGNDIVSAPPDLQLGRGNAVSAADPKGKGKAVPSFVPVTQGPQLQAPALRMAEQDVNIGPEEDANEAYFRQDNEDYAKYWEAHHTIVPSEVAPSQEWGQLQRDWEKFEATTTGVRPTAGYQFQQGNPYLLGERSNNHTMHAHVRSFAESVLHMEAAVQRDPNNPQAWFELGVRQQENERERQAISALLRALQLDPTHLPSWLALAISYTNEGDRQGTFQAVQSWIRQNERYSDIVSAFEAAHSTGSDEVDEFPKLISCLIAVARGTQGAEVDADVQIALAALLNTNEDYHRAQDCFRAALSVRPDDWLLYNRVGATLANGGRAEEALPYYYRALEINPAYIRARFNLGISCINLNRYEEAAQHILDALVLQESDGLRGLEDNHDVTSRALWDSLKTSCLQMQRVDLAAMCDNHDLEGIRNQIEKSSGWSAV